MPPALPFRRATAARPRRWAAALTALACAALVTAVPAPPARAATFFFAMVGERNPGCTLERVIELSTEANSTQTCGDHDVIIENAIAVRVTSDIVLDEPLPEITGSIDINGRYAGETHSISRAESAPAFRLFTVRRDASLRLSNLTLSGGRAAAAAGADGADGGADGLICAGEDPGPTPACAGETGDNGNAARGGAILVDQGSLTLTRVVLTDHAAVGGDGGDGGTGKDGTDGGGGLVIDGQRGGHGGDGGVGGAAYGGAIYADRSTVTITESVLRDNTATGGDGGSGQDGGSGGDGSDAGSATCAPSGDGIPGRKGGDGGDGGDAGDGRHGGSAFGAAIFARYGTVTVQRTAILDHTGTGGDAGGAGSAGGAGDGGASKEDEKKICSTNLNGYEYGGEGGEAGVGGADGLSDRVSNAMGAAVFFDGYTDNDTLGNANGSFTLRDSTVSGTLAAPGTGVANTTHETWDCQEYHDLSRQDQLCDAMYRDDGVGTAVAGDGALEVIASTIAGNTTRLSLAKTGFDDPWQLNAGLMQAWISDTDASRTGPDSPNWHSMAWTDPDWSPTVPVKVTSSIVGPNHIETTDGATHLPAECRAIVDQTGGIGGQAGWSVRALELESGGDNVFYGESADRGSACASGGGDSYLTGGSDDQALDLTARGPLMTSYELPGGHTTDGYVPSGVALGNGGACGDGDDLDQAGQPKAATGCDVGAVQKEGQQPIEVPVELSGSQTYGGGDQAFDAEITDPSDLPDGLEIDAGGIVCSEATDGGTPTDVTDLPVGEDYPLSGDSCTGGGFTGPKAAHYTPTYTGTITVQKKDLTITASSPTIAYGDAVPEIEPEYDGLVNSETAGDALTTMPSCSTEYQAGATADSYATSCGGAASENYALHYEDGTLTVAPGSLTAVVNGTMRYGESTEEAIFVPELPTGEFFDGTIVCTELADGTAIGPTLGRSPQGGYTIDGSSCTGPGTTRSGNYALSFADGSLQVLPALLRVTPSSPTITYGEDAPEITATYGGWQNDDGPEDLTTSASCAADYDRGDPVGGYPTTCTGATADNYVATTREGTLTVEGAPLQVTASDATITFGDAPPTIGWDASGLVLSESVADAFTTDPTCGTSYTEGDQVGTYSTTCDGAVADNYAIEYVAGTLTVEKAAQAVEFTSEAPENATYGDSITISASGAASGQPTTLTVAPASQDVCSLEDPSASEEDVEATLVLTGVGTCTVQAHQQPDANHLAGEATQEFEVGKATVTVIAPSVELTYGDATPDLAPTYSGWQFEDGSDVLTTAPTCQTAYQSGDDTGSYPTWCDGVVSDLYTARVVNGAIDVAPATLRVQVDDKSMRWGAAVPDLTFRYAGFVLGQGQGIVTTAPTCQAGDGTVPVTGTSPLGDYPITCTGGEAPNYRLESEPGVLHIAAPKGFGLTVDPRRVARGQEVAITGDGLPAGTTLDLTLHSAPQALGDTTVSPDLTYAVDVTVPRDAALGRHQVRATATLSDGTVLTEQVRITVTAADQGPGGSGDGNGNGNGNGDGSGLPDTGGPTWWLLLLGGLAVAAGVAMVARVRRVRAG